MEEIFRVQLKDKQIISLASFITAIIAIIDLFFVTEIIIGIAYIAVIFLVSFCTNRRIVYIFNFICSALVVLGIIISNDLFFISPKEIINRLIALMSIWLVASITMQHRYSENKFLQIIEASPTAQLVVNYNGKILLLNQEAIGLFGYSRDELLGQSVDILVPERFRIDHPTHRKGFFVNPEKRAMGAGRDLYGLKKDSTEVPIEIGLNPLKTKDGLYVLASIIDISERKKNENAISTKNKELETLLYIASHDLKEPLRSMEYFSSVVNERYNTVLDDKAKVFLSKITDSSAHMAKLLDDINLMSKASKMSQELNLTDFKEIVQEVLNRLQEKIKLTRAQIHISDDLPILKINRIWVTEAIYNLISNALKFTKENEVPDIEIDVYDKDLLPFEKGIVIKDRGLGVKPEYAEKIFGLFQRAVGREIEGSGTGLAIVKSVAEGHGGRVWVQKRSSGGSEFVITFRR